MVPKAIFGTILAAIVTAGCAAMPNQEGGAGVSESTMQCAVAGKPLPALTSDEICAAFRGEFAEKGGLGIAVEVRSGYEAAVTVSDADGATLLQRDLTVMDAGLNRQAFEAMAKSLAAELSRGRK